MGFLLSAKRIERVLRIEDTVDLEELLVVLLNVLISVLLDEFEDDSNLEALFVLKLDMLDELEELDDIAELG